MLGATGTGKTYTMAQVIQAVQRPTLVLAPNKTLAAQLCSEFKEFFPDNAVEYFVSYYDYYQPEAYIPQTDTYIEKDSSINDEIDKLRHSATTALFERRDVIIVASVSCIYGLGDPEEYSTLVLSLRQGECYDRDTVLRKLVDIQYERNEVNFTRGKFRVRGDVLEIFPASARKKQSGWILAATWWKRCWGDALTGEILGLRNHVAVFPASHYATSGQRWAGPGHHRGRAGGTSGRTALRGKASGSPAPGAADPLRYGNDAGDGLCSGIENYSATLRGGSPTAALHPAGLFPQGFYHDVDESHVAAAPGGGDVRGRPLRKESLVETASACPRPLTTAPDLCRVSRAAESGHLRFSHAGTFRAGQQQPGGGANYPAHRAG